MEVRVRHPQLRADAIEAELPIGLLERERVIAAGFASVHDPLVHPPEVRVREREPELVDEPRDERQLLGRPDRPADARPVRPRVACRQAVTYSSASAR